MNVASENDPPPISGEEVKKRAIRGSGIAIVGKLAEQGIRFGSNLILTRLLFPEAFGLMGLIITLLVGLELLSDLGVRISIITHRREDADFLDTAFTISVLRGIALWVLAAIFAFPFAAFYNEPQLKPMIWVAGMGAVFLGATSSNLHVMNRQIRVGRLIAVQFIAQIVGVIVMVAVAAIFRSAWALVLGSLSIGITTCLLSHTVIPGRRNRFRWDPAAARDIMTMGSWIIVSTMLSFLAGRIDVLMLGKLVSKAALGVYSISNNLSSLPAMVSGQIVGAVLLPALANAYRQDPGTLAATFKRARGIMMPVTAYVCLGVALGSPALFYFLFDTRYHDAAWMTPLMTFTAWFTLLQETSSRALQAMGTARPLAAANAARLLGTTIACIVGNHFYGITGFIVGGTLGALCGHLVTVILLIQAKLPAGLDDMLYTVGGLAVAVLGVGGPIWLEKWAGVPRMPVSVGVALVILVPSGWWTLRRLLAERHRV